MLGDGVAFKGYGSVCCNNKCTENGCLRRGCHSNNRFCAPGYGGASCNEVIFTNSSNSTSFTFVAIDDDDDTFDDGLWAGKL